MKNPPYIYRVKQKQIFSVMTYRFTISDKGCDSRQSNSYELALEYAKVLSIENGNPVTIKCNRGFFSETFIWSETDKELIPNY